MKFIVLDFETYYDTKNGYGLKTLSVPEYIGHKDFKVHCLGVEVDGVKTILWGDEEIKAWLKTMENEDDYAFVFHNAFFDLGILVWHYGFVPKFVTDTLLMANHVLGSARDSGGSNALGNLAELLGFQAKGRLDVITDGVRDLTEGQKARLGEYLETDLDLTRRIFNTLKPWISNINDEMWLLDHTLKMYATRPLILNFDTVKRAEVLIQKRRDEAYARLLKANPEWPPDYDYKKMLSAQTEFQRLLLQELARYNQPMPTKKKPTTKAARAKWEKAWREINMAKAGAPADIVAQGEKAVKKWNKWAAKVLEKEHLLPDKLGDVTVVPALSKQDEEFLRLASSPFEGLAALVSARLVHKSSETSTGRLNKMRAVASGIGKMPVQLNYYGAHTGRFAGGGGFNFQNMTSPDRTSDLGQKAIAYAIREAFEAPEGMSFISADAAQIEARVSAWITGQWDLLDKFKKKIDVYSSFISEALGEEIRKPRPDDAPAVASRMKIMRSVGKESVLGLGYSMGATKFITRLRANPDIAQMFIDGTMDEDFAKAIVKKYREMHTKITDGWTNLQEAFFHALSGGVRTVGPVTFRRGKAIGSMRPVVTVTLPSGRVLYYRNIRKEAAKNKAGYEWKHGGGQRLYGGLILENITQAISRDIIVESIERMEFEYDVPVVLHVHDSISGLTPDELAEKNLDRLITSLRTNPKWAGNRLVLDAEGKIGKTLVM